MKVLIILLLLLISNVIKSYALLPSISKIQLSNKLRHSFALSSSQSITSTSSSSLSSSSSSVLSSAAFIAGTTIGGGFLLLPLSTVPLGFVPSVIGLIFAWLYLLGSALSLSKATINIMKRNQSLDTGTNISVFAIAKDTFGNLAGIIAAGLFIILMLSTLVAQLSKIGILLPSINMLFNKETAIASFALFMSIITFGRGIQFAERINNILTLTMMIAFGSIITAAPKAGFDFSRLFYRSNFRSLLPFNYESSITWAVPVFLQLLVYTETIPLVVSRLDGDEKKIKKAILLGSVIPLIMCIIWSMIAIGLVPVDIAVIDPVDILLKSSPSKRIKSSLLLLTLSAVSTTVIGSCLTISQFLDDILKEKKVLSKPLSIIPASLIAALGSQSLYYAATRFAGAFPVTLLWGLFPPVALLKTLERESLPTSPSKNIGQYILIFLSISMLIINII